MSAPECIPPAAAALREWLAARGLSQGQLARILGVHRPSVSQWCAGTCRPPLHIRAALDAAGGPRVGAWATELELLAAGQLAAKLAAALAAVADTGEVAQ